MGEAELLGVGVVEFGVLEDGLVGGRSVERECITLLVSGGSEGVVAVIEHALGEALLVGSHLDAEISEHGVGTPATHQADVVAIDTGHHEGRSSAGAERTGRDEVRVDASDVLACLSSVTEGVGDESRANGMPFLVGRIVVV